MDNYKSVQRSKAVGMTADEVFAKYEGLTQYIAIYVPSTRYNQPIDNTEWVKCISKFLAGMFGGATAYDALGGYVAQSGEYISENVKIVKAYAGNITGDMARRVISMAQDLKGALEQECVAVEYNGKLMFI